MRQPIYDDNSNLIGYGKFIKDTTGDNAGNYVDNELNNEVTAAENSYFFDAAIIPTVQYQVYGLDNVWFWDNEGQNYTFDETTKSTIKIQLVAGTKETYYKVGTLTLGNAVEGAESLPTEGTKVSVENLPDELPSDATVGKVYYKAGSTENTYDYKVVSANSFDVTEDAQDIKKDSGVITSTSSAPIGSKAGDVFHTVTEILDPSDATDNTPYEFNKYGKERAGYDVLVYITPAEALVQKYPGAIVTINGKEYDLNYLANITVAGGTYTVGSAKPIRLYMDKDYRISINWSWGSVVETFRIICNR